MKKAIKLGLVSLVLCSNSQFIFAATPGAYLGGGVGVAQLAQEVDFDASHENVLGGRVFFGYNVNNYFGLEANYSALGKTHYYMTNNPLITADYSLNAVGLVGKLYLPLSKESPASIYGFVGGAQLWGNLDLAFESVFVTKFSSSAFVPTGGVGLSYDINQHLRSYVEVAAFGEKESSDEMGIPRSFLATFGLAYKF